MSTKKTMIRQFLIIVFCLFLIPFSSNSIHSEKRIYFINEREMSKYEKDLFIFSKNRIEEKTCGLISFDAYFVNMDHTEFFLKYQQEDTLDFQDLESSKKYFKEMKNEYVGFWKRNIFGHNHITIAKDSVMEFEIPTIFAHEILHSYNVQHVKDSNSVMNDVMNIPSINFEFSKNDIEAIENSLHEKVCP